MKSCKAFLFAAVLALLPVISFSQIPTNGLVGHWKFNNGSTIDASPTNSAATNHGTLMAVPDRFGNDNMALQFDGNSYVEVIHSEAINPTTAFTISAWVKKTWGTETTTGNAIVSKSNSGYGTNVNFRLEVPFNGAPNNQIALQVTDASNMPTNSYTLSASEISSMNNQWVHIVAIFDGTTQNAKTYINGVLKAESTQMVSALLGNTQPLFIGCFKSGNYTYSKFTGAMDDIRFYSRALNSTEITALYNEPNPAPQDCIAHWSFDGHLNDEKGSFTGTYNGSNANPSFSQGVNGKASGAISLNGSDEYISTNIPWNSFASSDFSITFHMKPANDNAHPSYMAALGSESSLNNGLFWNKDGQGELYFRVNANTNQIHKAIGLKIDTWQHLAIVKQGNSVTIYLDGFLFHSANMAAGTSLEKFIIGALSPTYGWFKGSIDEMSIYQRALNIGEIEALIQKNTNTDVPPSPWIQDASKNLSYTDGSVVIGGTDPGTYKLRVNGSVSASQVVVEVQNLADYVFEEDYDLRSLEEVEAFIDENGHLPEIPSAAQVKEEGMSVGEMNNLLLQKVEELTLYILELNKAQQRLQQELQQENTELRNEIEKLKE